MLDNFLEECCIGDKRNYSEEEVEEEVEKAFKNLQDWRSQAILRGFCYHHSGFNNKKRVCVEKLFRTKRIKLVFCTSTLAQGIHVPCKTVLFLGDSIFLESSTFKQCAGRAGRRGFDIHANVIFLNIPEIKVKQLISSKPPIIFGSFLPSPSFILSLLNITHGCKSSVKNALNVLKNGILVYSLNEDQKRFLNLLYKFYFLFCCEFLYNQSLIDLNGIPRGLSKFTICFSWQEPGNLVLNHLIRTDALEKMCISEPDEGSRHQKIMIVLSYLFNRVDIRNNENVAKRLSYNSKVILDDLPKEIADSFDQYNKSVDQLFKKNLKFQNNVFNKKIDYILPLSKYDYSSEKSNDVFVLNEIQSLVLDSGKSFSETEIISNFSSLSGLNDKDILISDKSILMHIKPFYLDYKDLYPTIENSDSYDFYGKKIKFNCYLLDFFNHGVYKSILDENKLPDGTAFKYLTDFKKILSNLCRFNGYSRFFRTLESLKSKFDEMYEKADFDMNEKNDHRNKKFSQKVYAKNEKLKPKLREDKTEEKLLKQYNVKNF